MVEGMKVFVFFLIFILSSCSLFRADPNFWNQDLIDDERVSDEDFLDHFNSLAESFINNSDVKVVKLQGKVEEYLNKIIRNLTKSNDLFFKKTINNKNEFYIVKDKRPFHFSTPDGKIFLSDGLIKKYIEHESNLVCVLAFEIIKIEKNLFPRKITIPKGYISLLYFVSILRIPLEEKIKVHHWAYYIIKRSGYDENGYLTWIQTQNRNYMDFSFHLGDYSSIFKEESSVKDFVVKNYGNSLNVAVQFSSSKDFFKFLSVVN